MSKNGVDILKAMAQQAKDRLRGKSAKCDTASYQKNFRVLYNSKLNNKSTIISDKEDERLYKKMRDIIERDNVINPIGELIDKHYYKTLNEDGKERYFFKLVDKYREFKEKYEEDKLKETL